MARSRSTSPPTPQSADLSPAQIRAAIPLLEARIKQLDALDVGAIRSQGDPNVVAAENAVQAALARIYGPDSHDYHRLLDAAEIDAIQKYTRPLPARDVQEQVEHHRQRSLVLLRQEIAVLREQLGEDGETAGDRAIRSYSSLDLHPDIARAASGLYRDEHFADAVVAAVKALNALVRYRSDEGLDGTALMEKVFSPKNPILRFNDLADQSDHDEQRGFMMMFSGAVAGLRNPRAHKFINDDPERALEFIAYISLLAKLLDGAKRANP